MTEDFWDRRVESFDRHPGWTTFRWLLGAVLLVLLLMVVLMPFGWGFAWLKTARDVAGPDNTRDQAFALRDDYRSLEATAGNVCDVGRSGSSSKNDPTLVEHPDFAYRAQYRRIKADYDRRMDNAFEAGWVRHYPFLNDLPREAPTLSEMTARAC
jgi:hypothetical protein